MEEPMQKKSQNNGSISHWNYDILRVIFQYLPVKDLDNAAKVGRIWLEAAQKEKQTRRHPDYITRVYSSSEEQLDSIWIHQPSIEFHFHTLPYPLTNRHCQDHRTLSRNYDSMIFKVASIIVEENHEDGTKMVFRRFSPDIFYVLSAYLPQISHVRISTSVLHLPLQSYEVGKKTLKKFVNKLKIARTSKQNHENSVCFMMFYSYSYTADLSRMIDILRGRYKNKRVTIWGGRVDHIYSKQANNSSRDIKMAVVAISGLIQSWSVPVKISWPVHKIENRLAVFKDQVKLKKYSIGFVFASSYPRISKLSKKNESTIFKRFFPQVPLVGCESRGSILVGNNIDPLSNADEQEKYKRKDCWPFEEVCSNPWYTVFMILTYD